MANLSDFFPNKPISTFFIIKLSEQISPEIDPVFVRQHFHNLKKKWHVLNNDGVFENLVFNKDYVHPLINKGWTNFKNVNNLPDDVEVEIACYGPTMFKLIKFKEISNHDEIKKFNSRCTNPTETTHFDILLDANNITSNQLKLPFLFANYLKDNLLHGIILCGDNGFKEHFQVIHIADCTKTALGYDWKDFAQLQFFETGDMIRFKFDLLDSTGKCQVFKFNN